MSAPDEQPLATVRDCLVGGLATALDLLDSACDWIPVPWDKLIVGAAKSILTMTEVSTQVAHHSAYPALTIRLI